MPGRKPVLNRHNGPQAPKTEPQCPKHLDKVAKAKWLEAAGILREMELLSTADATLLQLFAETWSRYQAALDFLQKNGNTFTAVRSGYEVQRPEVAILNKSGDMILKLTGELGLSPVARARMGISKKKNEAVSKFAEFGIAV